MIGLIVLLLAQSATIELQDEGTRLGPISHINCSGAGITCTRSSSLGTITIVGVATDAGAVAPLTATYITQTPNSTLTNEQAMSALSTGIVKVTTSTGVLSTAVAGDFPTLNQSTTGNALTCTTAVALASNPADCAADQYATAIAANGDLTCGTVSAAAVSNFSLLPGAITVTAASDGGVITFPKRAMCWYATPGSAALVTDGMQGNAFTPADTITHTVADRHFLRFLTSASSGQTGGAMPIGAAQGYHAYSPRLIVVARLDPSGAGFTNARQWIGFDGSTAGGMRTTDTPGASADLNYVAFRYSSSASDTKYICCTGKAGTDTCTSSGVIPVAGQTTVFDITVNPGVSNIFKINGSVVCTHTTNLQSTTAYWVITANVYTLAASARSIELSSVCADTY